MDAIKSLIGTISRDQRVLAMLLGWGLVGFIEGIAGFGTPAVLAAPLLVYFGMKPLKAVAVAFIIAMTQLLLLSGNNAADLPSIPEVLGQGLARIFNDTFVLVSTFIGALGSFMTGSATVSNLLFGGLQLDTARALSMAVPSILALQLVGAGVGNMSSLQNIAMAAGAAGLEAREGQVIRETILPMLVVCTAAGLLFLLW